MDDRVHDLVRPDLTVDGEANAEFETQLSGAVVPDATDFYPY